VLPLPCRAILWGAERLVPRSAREDWREEYAGGLWQWILDAAAAGTPDSRFALVTHTRRALLSALRLRFGRDQLGAPVFCLGLSVLAILILVIGSRGFPVLRQFVRGLPYRDAQNIVVLAQGPPFFGIRLGFRDRETDVFRAKSQTLEGVATYMWGNTVFRSSNGHRGIIAAEVSPEFFNVLGAGPAIGHGLDGSDAFLASFDFWEKELHRNPAAIGEHFDVGGRPMRLAGVLPRGFSFLSTPISVWIAAAPEAPVPARQWWLALRGAVARLRPGVAPDASEKELRQLLVNAHIARRNFRIRATPIADLVYRPFWSYGFDFLLCTLAVLFWAAFNIVRDRRRGATWEITRRFWGFFVLKAMLPLIALFLFVFEFTGATRLGVTGGVRPSTGGFYVWAFYSAIALILIWAWRDQPGRCRVCLHRMRQPVRIGVPGQILLETAGQEVMCPQGHGSVYTSDSVLGADLSDRWMGFP
jgi:hypothetical protein